MTMLRNCELYDFRVRYDFRQRHDVSLGSEPSFTDEHSDKIVGVVAPSLEVARAWLRERYRTHDNLRVDIADVREAPFVLLEVPY